MFSSRVRAVLERPIKAQTEGFDVNFYILNKGVHILDVRLSYKVLKLRQKLKNAVLSIKANCL